MLSGQFYEKWVSVRERNIKLLLETVTYIATTETVTCIITIEIVIHDYFYCNYAGDYFCCSYICTCA